MKSATLNRHLSLCIVLAAIFGLLAPPLPTAAQVGDQATTTPMAADIEEKTITAQIEGIRAAPNLSDEEKTQLINLYTQALQALKKLVAARDEAARFSEMSAAVEQERERLDNALASSTDPAINVPSNATRAELEKLKADADTTGNGLKQQLDFWENELSRRQTRATEIPIEIAAARAELEKLKTQLSEAPATNEKPEATVARQTNLAAQQLFLTQRLAALEAEQQAYAATNALVPKQQELARKEYRSFETYRKSLEEKLRAQTAKETQEKVEQAEARQKETLAELKPLAEEVVKITEEYQAQMRTIAKLETSLVDVQNKIKAEDEDFEKRKNRLETLGLTNAIGRLLREKQVILTRQRLTISQLRRENSDFRTPQEQTLTIAERRNDLLDEEPKIREALINDVLLSYPDIDPIEVQNEVDSLLRARLDNLALLQTAYQSTFEKMVAVDSTRLEFIRLIDEHIDYIEERILWVRSDAVLGGSDFTNVAADFRDFLTVARWTEVLRQLKSEWVFNLTFGLLFLILVSAIVAYRPRAKRSLLHEGTVATKRNCRTFVPTAKAALLSLLLSALWPALLAVVGWRLSVGSDQELFGYALGHATIQTAVFLLPFEWLRQVTRPGGLAECHFGTSPAMRSILRTHSRLFSLFAVGAVWLTSVNFWLANRSIASGTWSGSLGRLAFLTLMALFTLEAAHAFNPKTGIPALMGGPQSKHLLFRLRYPIFVLSLLVFPTLFTLAIVGYYYTAIILVELLFRTFCMLVVVVTLATLIRRWLLVRRRKLAMKQYRERLEKQRERADSNTGQVTSEILPFDIPDDAVVDLAALNDQTLRLFYGSITLLTVLGLWLIWGPILPALNQFGRYELWSVAVAGEVVSVTLGHLLLASIVFMVTFFAYKNLPALLEMFLLQHLPFDSGARFAITTISRYAIVIVGTIIGLSIIKVQFAQYSWLVAGASVGLGFGMQEIFANFVSGLIVLLERPCRVGDVVTVGDVTGVVSRIQIRATTVTNWDRQELIVPNKEFVTGRLLNWTLSSAVNRVVIPVGIAYGSDTQLATELLLGVVRGNANVLDDPAPNVTFERFGASSLDFTVRCYLPTLDNRLGTIHELHSEIDRVFRENGIEIAFPQQDLHVRSLSGDIARQLSESFLAASPQNGNKASST